MIPDAKGGASASAPPGNRSFGLVFFAFFLIVAFSPLIDGGGVRTWAVVIALVFGAVAVVAPALLTPLNRLWTRFGDLLHRVMSPLLLGVVFFLVVTPIGLLIRLTGQSPLRLRFDPAASSYWIARRPPAADEESGSMRRQF